MTAQIIPFPRPNKQHEVRSAFLKFRRATRDFWMESARRVADEGGSEFCIKMYVAKARRSNHLIVEALKSA